MNKSIITIMILINILYIKSGPFLKESWNKKAETYATYQPENNNKMQKLLLKRLIKSPEKIDSRINFLKRFIMGQDQTDKALSIYRLEQLIENLNDRLKLDNSPKLSEKAIIDLSNLVYTLLDSAFYYDHFIDFLDNLDSEKAKTHVQPIIEKTANKMVDIIIKENDPDYRIYYDTLQNVSEETKPYVEEAKSRLDQIINRKDYDDWNKQERYI